MRGRDVIISLSCVLLAVVMLVVAGSQLDYINDQRHEMGLTINEPLENAPPSLAFATVAMGAFRGLVVDILWMRADTLKEEGQFFDARQLAEWITTLQPRFAAVWEFHAWNMAYNISVALPASQPQERWRWVKNGYELLRDKGIPLNPKSIQLYRELGRIFQHKMGGVSDDAHKYYKLQLAQALGPLLQSPDNGLEGDENAFFEALIRAPTDWEQIANDPNIRPLIEALKASDEDFADESLFVRNYLALRQTPQGFEPAAFDVIDRYRGTETLKRFDLFAKAYQLRDEWKLEPHLMHEVNQTYGPIDFADPNVHYPMDWRHPDCHAIYWAVKGLKVAEREEADEIDMHQTNTYRIVMHSLQNLFRYGRISILEGAAKPLADERPDPNGMSRIMRRDIFLAPDLRYFDSYNKATLAFIEKHEAKDERGTAESLQNGHRNMLKNAAFQFYQSGIKGYALRIYNELRRRYPIDDFKVPLEQYVQNRFREELESIAIHDAREMITAILTQSYYHYAIYNDDMATRQEEIAQQVYDYYMNKYRPENRIDLPPMRVLRYVAITEFLNNGSYPLYVRQGLVERIRVERPDLYEQFERTAEDINRRMEEVQETQGH
jgi:hypothetical protein